MKIVFIGAGNLATAVSLEMQRAGMTIGQIYSRTRESAESLAKKLNTQWTTNLNEIIPDADLYIFALKDALLTEIIPKVKPNEGLWVHTAGSVPMQIFEGHAKRYGVFYPLQTFTKKRRVKLDKTPIFLEVNNPEDMKMLKKVAIALSGNAQELDSEKRKMLHLAAVFACNFTNHMYALAAKLLEEQSLSYELILPLIIETADKISEIPPSEAQTGPAVRFEKEIMDKQIAMLSDPGMQTIYRLISQNIYKEKLQHEQY
ncbi:putative short-subunit dehydrogenase-like oxidoreductase (DUF2520 family) [Parabacteroides sp. PF5-5]|uniref:Rossmann-like and DUF2520 domain-containing protein n=1 Tax=unclassified Parabacteroides TaxID=2649774 RepID=UPI00247479EF|nr:MULTISPECIES: Rossmann-like and DUF2520 domain-containing protein [unclassified Parabacteroides]MDH6306570.1 putative short-subunit dehydrogenase-like oxidoreductase (DUF2520 family) [Parabacteroides sp. PH5-39]MDH6317537.1 putative short-subunit dehydrogenase-like oxidoreductase (DUF2520 family) [Parabacteroides sp. PF5-13]MDH6321281.1 putative short-subunit dehydrogenase-like oxidoreductase (DUF2520 family) [Parabacteroides sp. PH5-13]MDH6325013.1 putative short-subunit dehydrogenase-like 